jgi:hypothetical protein
MTGNPRQAGFELAAGVADPMRYDCNWTPVWKCALTSSMGTSSMAFEVFNLGPQLNWMASSQEGEVAFGDGFPAAGARKSISVAHHGPVVSVAESPFIAGTYLTVGDWTFHIWRV